MIVDIVRGTCFLIGEMVICGLYNCIGGGKGEWRRRRRRMKRVMRNSYGVLWLGWFLVVVMINCVWVLMMVLVFREGGEFYNR